MRLRFVQRLAGIVAMVICLGGVGLAQAPTLGKLILTVVDQSGGVIPNATVTIAGLEDVTRLPVLAPLQTSDKGVATVENLKPGRYSIVAEFPGFDPNTLKDVRIKAGDNKQGIVLSLKRVQDSVTVTQDRQLAGSSREVLFGSVLTREQIEALSDDPAEMRRQLESMAGPDARILVDSFEGSELPHKSQIKSIRISRDQFAAEGHMGGGGIVDIITSPGLGPLRTSFGGNFHNNAMEAKNPFAPTKGPAQSAGYSASLGGALIKDRATFSIRGSQNSSYSTPNFYGATSAGTVSENLALRAYNSGVNLSGTLDYAVTKDQTIRFGYTQSKSNSRNNGVGNYDRIERAWSSDNNNFSIRFTEAGPVGRRMFINTRFMLNWRDSDSRSAVEAQTIRIIDANTSGGAQVRGGSHTRAFTLNSDLDYVRGKHSWRTGVQVEGTRYHADSVSNYLGTYTFESLAAFEANTPRSFTRRIGDPNISYWHAQVGWYVQDDIRPRKNLSISPGVRLEAQTHLNDYFNVSPRFGFTWSPFKSGKTSVRSSWGIFYDWLPANTYLQTIQNDGYRLQEVNIANPVYPDPGPLGAAPPINRYQFGDDLSMIKQTRVSASVNQTLTRRLSLSSTFQHVRGDNLLVGSNLNAPDPITGVRPNPLFVNVYATNADGRSRSSSVSAYLSMNLAPMAPSAPAGGAAAVMGPVMMIMPGGSTGAGKLFEWRRGLYVSTNYYLGKSENNTDGAFSVPSTGDLALEWGPSNGDIRHRVGGSLSSGAFKNVNLSMDFNWSSAPPITIRTGTDDNHDLILNDRPADVGRNSARTVSNWSSYSYISYSLGFGRKLTNLPPGVMITSSGGVMAASTMQMPSTPKYRLNFSVSIENITNHHNPSGFSGTMTSPFFMKPTSAFGQRSVYFNMGLSF